MILRELLENSSTPSDQDFELIVSDATSAEDGSDITKATSQASVNFETGIKESFVDLISGSSKNQFVTDIVAKDSNVKIEIKDPIFEFTNTNQVSALNSLMQATNGQIVANIKGSSDLLKDIDADNGTNTHDLTIAVNSEVTLSKAKEIVAATKKNSVDFQGNLKDSFAILSQDINGLQTVTGKDGDINIEINDTSSVNINTDNNVTSLNNIMASTNGEIIATINGPSDKLKTLDSDTVIVNGLSNNSTKKQKLTITVNDTAKVDAARKISDSTQLSNVSFANGIKDTLDKFGSGSIDVANTMTRIKDSDVNITIDGCKE